MTAVGGGPLRALWSNPAVAWAVLVAVVVLGVIIVGRPAREGSPLDPSSTAPLGTRALVVLLEELGAHVDITNGVPPDGHDVVLVLADDLDEAGRAEVQDRVREGSTLVVGDPRSPLNPFPIDAASTVGLVEEPFDDDCAIPALTGVARIEPPPGSATYELVPGSEGCYRRGGASFLAVTAEGRGTVVAVGGAGLFTNQSLGRGDNAVFAATIIAPRPGISVAVLQPPRPGSGDGGLVQLVGDNVKASLWQLGLAFGLYAWWRARRLGLPVAESQPVRLEASELVVAVSHLLQQGRHHDEAARTVGDDLRLRLAERMGLAGDAPAVQVAEVAAARSGVPAERIMAVIMPPPLGGSDALVAHVAEAEAISREVVHA
ncbi:MAG: DUF4350 domain-containing protein [Acidimicrobiales bacterium]